NLRRFADSYIDILDFYTDVKEFLIELATVKASTIKCLGLVWSRQKKIQTLYSKELGLVFATSLKSNFTDNDKTLVLDEETLLSIFNRLKNRLQNTKYIAIHIASLESFKKVIEKIKGSRIEESELGVEGRGLRIEESGSRIEELGSRIKKSGLRIKESESRSGELGSRSKNQDQEVKKWDQELQE
ncbi:36553_t:CDS:2, partial [Racocetra persica]